MRKILIIGAGQCGLLLGNGLLSAGHNVTLVSARDAEQTQSGPPLSTQSMYEPALAIERRLGIDHLIDQTPPIGGMHATVILPGGGLEFTGRLRAPARSTDQRLKMAAWMEEFEKRGGQLLIKNVNTRDLDDLATSGRYDLIVVASGRGDLAALFDRDTARSPYTTPQRGLSVMYVRGMEPDRGPGGQLNASLTLIPGVGEFVLIPALASTGPDTSEACDIVLTEAVPGGPMDIFDSSAGHRIHPADQLQRTLALMREHAPHVYDRCRNIELAGPLPTLIGRFAPTVRRPVGTLDSGGIVLGVADVVVTNDPVTGQGANTAARWGDAILTAILQRGSEPFDRAWMERTSEQAWDEFAGPATEFTNMMLAPPPAQPPHLPMVLGAAAQYPEVADRLTEGYVEPASFDPWFTSPEAAAGYLADVAARDPLSAPTAP
jgi:hypothetical protein